MVSLFDTRSRVQLEARSSDYHPPLNQKALISRRNPLPVRLNSKTDYWGSQRYPMF
jgi:hypothetical protein